jgi:hypothetical protein
MITAEQIPDEAWRVAMMTYHREVRRNPQQAWQLALAAALTTWPGATDSSLTFEGYTTSVFILPLPREGADE